MSRQPSTEAFTGELLISVKVSREFKDVVRLAASHEHRTVSGFVRRALMNYLVEGGYFQMPDLDGGGKIVEDLVTQAEEELRGSQ